MNPVEILGDLASLVALQMADKVPDEALTARFFNLFDAFLDEIFAKITLPGGRRFENLLERLFLADSQQPYGLRRGVQQRSPMTPANR